MRSSSAADRGSTGSADLRSALIVALLLWSALLAASAPRLDPAGADQAARILERSAAGPPSPTDLARARSLLPPGVLPAPPTLGRDALSRNVSLLRDLAGPAPTPSPGAGASPGAALERVLSRPEFGYLGRPAVARTYESPAWWTSFVKQWKEFWASVGRAIGDFFASIGRLFSRLFPRSFRPPRPPNPDLGWLSGFGAVLRVLLWAIVIGLLLYVTGVLVSRYLATRAGPAPLRPRRASGGREAPAESSVPPVWEDAVATAADLYNSGDRRGAVRLLSRICLHLLDSRGILRYDETRANGEVLRELRRTGRRSLVDGLRPVLGAFDRVWYGLLDITPSDFGEVLLAVRSFRSQVAEGQPLLLAKGES